MAKRTFKHVVPFIVLMAIAQDAFISPAQDYADPAEGVYNRSGIATSSLCP